MPANYTYKFYPFINQWTCSVQVDGLFYGGTSLFNTKEDAKVDAETQARNAYFQLTEEEGEISMN